MMSMGKLLRSRRIPDQNFLLHLVIRHRQIVWNFGFNNQRCPSQTLSFTSLPYFEHATCHATCFLFSSSYESHVTAGRCTVGLLVVVGIETSCDVFAPQRIAPLCHDEVPCPEEASAPTSEKYPPLRQTSFVLFINSTSSELLQIYWDRESQDIDGAKAQMKS